MKTATTREDPTFPTLQPSPTMQHVVDPNHRTVFVKFGKKLTLSDLSAYVKLLKSDPRFSPDFSELVDLRDVDLIQLEAQDFVALADRIDPFSPNARRAFLVSNSTQDHAVRMHRILRPEGEIRTFYSLEEAKQWIAAGDSRHQV